MTRIGTIFNNSNLNDSFDEDTEKLISEDQNESLSLLERIDAIIRINDLLNRKTIDKEKKINCQKILNNHLAFCSKILDINELQVILFSYILNSSQLRIEELAHFLKSTKVQCFKYLDDLDVLVNKRLIKNSGRMDYYGSRESDSSYWVPYEVIKALRESISFTPVRYYNLSRDDFFKHLAKLFKCYINAELSWKILLIDFLNLLEDNFHLEFVKKIGILSLTNENNIILCYYCIDFLSDSINEHFDIHPQRDFLNLLKDEGEIRFDLTPLFEKELIEYDKNDFRDREQIVLSKKASFELLGITESLHKKQVDSDLMKHEDIIPKELFYNAKEDGFINQLAGLLLNENYKSITERL